MRLTISAYRAYAIAFVIFALGVSSGPFFERHRPLNVILQVLLVVAVVLAVWRKPPPA